ncbi:DNA glycosylase AlkZ-like family protein [Alicyclobacillus ferrooxydans]|uniref:Winged helix DNA-binding domain-containing protein n=1 Tax=Alicyclobacillus ferrooxydans TaxID=471514 RepID=A0A0P9EJU5_9BACL|nr:crosslink repair DNA glycosylase YcaQ family protein [Alicyclobacillus ferrooxydans]KPV43278.1 hypothetical protein AN477_13660 [Alicyclobacillus ferrooxydans]
MAETRLELTRSQILAFRRRASALEDRLSMGPDSLRHAAWAGLQDSMPRAALLSIHARVEGTEPSTLSDPSLVQLWGPRFSVFVVAECDRAVFSLGRLPEDHKGLHRAEDLARRLKGILAGGRMKYGDAGRALGVHPNSLRYAATAGTILIGWDGAKQPTIWTVPAPEINANDARLELARRYLHVYGPTTAESFSQWAGISLRSSVATFDTLRSALTPVRSPIGDAWILTSDETFFRLPEGATAPARLLPSGDSYLLLQGRDRELLVPNIEYQRLLWTPRVWPGGLLVDGEIVGVWRRSGQALTVQLWRELSHSERNAVEVEVQSLPLADMRGQISIRWEP